MSVTIRNHKLKIKRWRWPTYEIKTEHFAGKNGVHDILTEMIQISILLCSSLCVARNNQAAFWNANAKFDEHMLNFATFFDRAMWCAVSGLCTGQQVNRAAAFGCSDEKRHRRCPNWFHWQPLNVQTEFVENRSESEKKSAVPSKTHQCRVHVHSIPNQAGPRSLAEEIWREMRKRFQAFLAAFSSLWASFSRGFYAFACT